MGTRPRSGTGTATLAGKLTLGREAADPTTGVNKRHVIADGSMAERASSTDVLGDAVVSVTNCWRRGQGTLSGAESNQWGLSTEALWRQSYYIL